MKTKRLEFLALAMLLTLSGVVIANSDADQTLLKQLDGYRQWATLTTRPLSVDYSSLTG